MSIKGPSGLPGEPGYDLASNYRPRAIDLLKRTGMNATRGNFTGISIIDKTINKSIKTVVKSIKQNLGFEFNIDPECMNPVNFNKITGWIAKNSPKAKKILANKKDAIILSLPNNSFFFKCDDATFCIVKTGSEYREMLADNANIGAISLYSKVIKDAEMYMYIFGRKAYKYKVIIDKILSGKDDDNLRVYTIHGEADPRSSISFRSLYQDMDNRSLDTIFLEGNQIDTITTHIDKFLANQDLYKGRGIVYKTGILLYGDPGTGKTSLIKALACKYHRDLILIDMTTFNNIGLETFTHSINIDDRKYIIALEDIDCVIADRENTNIDKDEKKVVNKLLQFLDSNSSPNNVIFIASTNHRELLDAALLREGRFDLQIEMKGIYKDKAIGMCKSFGLDKITTDRVLAEAESKYDIDLNKQMICQSKLQAMILRHSGMSLKAEEIEEDTPDNKDECRFKIGQIVDEISDSTRVAICLDHSPDSDYTDKSECMGINNDSYGKILYTATTYKKKYIPVGLVKDIDHEKQTIGIDFFKNINTYLPKFVKEIASKEDGAKINHFYECISHTTDIGKTEYTDDTIILFVGRKVTLTMNDIDSKMIRNDMPVAIDTDIKNNKYNVVGKVSDVDADEKTVTIALYDNNAVSDNCFDLFTELISMYEYKLVVSMTGNDPHSYTLFVTREYDEEEVGCEYDW